MKPKISDVAKVAGVSPTTVSRVLNNRGYIGKETREKVHEAMEKINYYPNDIARSLYIKKTFLIGVIFPTTSNPFYGQLIFHLENYANSLGYKVLLCNSQGREDKEKSYLQMLQRNQVDGVIAGAHNRGIEEYDIPNLPVVGFDRYLSKNTPVVSSDNYEGGRLASQLLIDKGCKNIIHINGPIDLETPANLRREAYEKVMRDNQLTPITYETTRDNEEVIKRLFDDHPEVDGIFASDDLIAANVMREARKRNISIPNDLKLIGYDGTQTTRILLPELSTIEQPIKDIAEKCVDILIKQIDGEREDIQQHTILPVRLIDAETT
ncbi:LacI family DNA-binding transcriptional regulator [Salipaludibacillus agaradhaerens]|uniref:LacI family DNA-binding transcriptional regulator n=1 Tax=Salipaludibacillus agaradhaerens TaxID=76935 RepID=A0A9Q4FYJ7_SALAG|nr:LacI family DNA-binding transcriptional regulator [Salipaludibacillus agaradhaerens]MCR6097740.1 LacI family DNA-binding transcriptional regulator [Salipaludibacillus agaradhaerens]MCR6112776.1 LacI family DNA-binding transcriptional regulator [Salipaludibacillus agaradhaerens]